MIRAFIALPLPGETRRALGLAQAGLPVGRPVPTENFHLTLAFLGEQPGPVLGDLDLALSRLAAPAVTLKLAGLGVFGSKQPRSLHALAVPGPGLSALREKILRAADESGLTPERRRFVPHVTLARFKGVQTSEDRAALERYIAARAGFTAPEARIDRVVLYRSYLGKGAPIYEELAEYPLG